MNTSHNIASPVKRSPLPNVGRTEIPIHWRETGAKTIAIKRPHMENGRSEGSGASFALGTETRMAFSSRPGR